MTNAIDVGISVFTEASLLFFWEYIPPVQPHNRLSSVAWLLLVGWFVAGCSSPAPSGQMSTQRRPAAPSFVNKVWSVESSNAVAPGQIYVFLSEGTLVVASPNGTPALGSWRHEGQTFTMVEEGVTYEVETLELTQDRFRIRMRNPGEPVEMTLVPAE